LEQKGILVRLPSVAVTRIASRRRRRDGVSNQGPWFDREWALRRCGSLPGFTTTARGWFGTELDPVRCENSGEDGSPKMGASTHSRRLGPREPRPDLRAYDTLGSPFEPGRPPRASFMRGPAAVVNRHQEGALTKMRLEQNGRT
jgi:hypothetical protein